MHSSVIIFDVKLKRACALGFYTSLFPFHFCVILAIVELEVLELVKVVAHHDQGIGVDTDDKGVSVEADPEDLIW